MLGYEHFANASAVFSGIELIATQRKGQFNVARAHKRAPGDMPGRWMAVLAAETKA